MSQEERFDRDREPQREEHRRENWDKINEVDKSYGPNSGGGGELFGDDAPLPEPQTEKD